MPKKYVILLAMLAILGAALIIYPTYHYGIGLSPDSVGYISTARSLISGKGFFQYDGQPFFLQPPLYPIILAPILEIALAINLIIFLSQHWKNIL
ncbi:MAG: hypothetical protein GWO30_06835 [Gammaproteobacteria bacterium]|nr:hypothetical protein [candidate division Zixibacteria bacterium]NIP49710.1 hypothetical protein [Gammaproteobacteria bacterium]NIR49286.1 hypothetical protein [candidate division KSB1 bacterium]NIS46346.1 hypothetical protein [candidate division Zixibacteria bacterium]NIU14435.1 hypothetical protein [candidate division Zixibacteria bacterium]